jgi:hypothetical protein
MRLLKSFLVALLVAVPASFGGGSFAQADSCWDHNGSLMRLSSAGPQRWLHYETTPHSWQASAGVYPGTLFFNGRNTGDYYAGNARVFSRSCPGNALEYYVEGPVSRNPLRITMRGTRDSNQQCQNTGNMVSDTLVFTYVRDC